MELPMAFLCLFLSMYSALSDQTRLPPRLQAIIENHRLANTLHQHYNALHTAASTILNEQTSRTGTNGLVRNVEGNMLRNVFLTFPHPLKRVPITPLRAPTTYQKTPLQGMLGMIRMPGLDQPVYGPLHRLYKRSSPKIKRRVEFVDGVLFKNHIHPSHVEGTSSTTNVIDTLPHGSQTLGAGPSQENNDVKERLNRSSDSGNIPQDDRHDVIPLPLPSHHPPHLLSHELETQELTSDISPRQAVASLKTLLLTLTVLRNFDLQKEEAKLILKTPGVAPSNMRQTKRKMLPGGMEMFRKRPFDSIANGLIGKRGGFRKRPFDPLASGLIGK